MNHPKFKPMDNHLVLIPGAPSSTGISHARHAAGRGAKMVLAVLSRAGELLSGAGSVYGRGGRPPKD